MTDQKKTIRHSEQVGFVPSRSILERARQLKRRILNDAEREARANLGSGSDDFMRLDHDGVREVSRRAFDYCVDTESDYERMRAHLRAKREVVAELVRYDRKQFRAALRSTLRSFISMLLLRDP